MHSGDPSDSQQTNKQGFRPAQRHGILSPLVGPLISSDVLPLDNPHGNPSPDDTQSQCHIRQSPFDEDKMLLRDVFNTG